MFLAKLILLGVCGSLLAFGQDPQGSALQLKVSPTAIDMSMFYKGAKLHIEGVMRTGSRVAVVVRGENHAEVFNRKVKVGPIWINSGKVSISGVPSLFLRFTDGMLRDTMAREDIDRYQIDQAAIQRQLEVEPDQDHEVMVASWLSLKAHDMKYALIRDGVTMGQPQGGLVPFSVNLDWPRKALPGDYRVSAYEYRDKHVVAVVNIPLKVQRVGFANWFVDIVMNRSLIYGIVTVLFAAIFGFGIDFLVALIFGKKAATAH